MFDFGQKQSSGQSHAIHHDVGLLVPSAWLNWLLGHKSSVPLLSCTVTLLLRLKAYDLASFSSLNPKTFNFFRVRLAEVLVTMIFCRTGPFQRKVIFAKFVKPSVLYRTL